MEISTTEDGEDLELRGKMNKNNTTYQNPFKAEIRVIVDSGGRAEKSGYQPQSRENGESVEISFPTSPTLAAKQKFAEGHCGRNKITGERWRVPRSKKFATRERSSQSCIGEKPPDSYLAARVVKGWEEALMGVT